MFIQLTRTDGLPIWLNASFIVTVEPTRSGGAIVVPIGDGLDYDVKESPETVLALLNEAPPAKVVPVPPPKALTHTPDDVSPEVWPTLRASADEAPKKQAKEEEPEPAPKKRGRGRRAKKSVDSDETKADAASASSPAGKADATSASLPMEAPADFDKIVAGLKAHKCRTARRLRNAIKGFFGKTDEAEIDHIVETMINRGFILIGPDGHIDWTA